MSVFAEEKALARRTGRCMACDAPTRHFTSKGRDKYALLCGAADCERYYRMLWRAAWREQRRAS